MRFTLKWQPGSNRYIVVGVILIVIGFGLLGISFGYRDGYPHLATVLVGVGAGLLPTGTIVLLEPWLVRNLSRSARKIASMSADQAIKDAASTTPTAVTVLCGSEPVAGASVIALAPNKAWKQGSTRRDGAAYLDLHDKQLPRTVFVAAEGYEAHVEYGWTPASHELTVELTALPTGGAIVCPNGTGYVPGLAGRLNPILDDLDRTYIYADNIAIDGSQQGSAFYFTPGKIMHMQDADGNEFQVCVVEIIGRSSLIEYRRHQRDVA